MIAVPFNRGKALRWTWAMLLAAGGAWFARVHRPAAQALATRERVVAEREARVRQARAAMVVLGPAGLDSALARFRSDSALLALRVPPDSAAPALASEVKAVLGAREGRDLRIVRTDPVQAGSEDGFRAAGYAVTAVGRFSAIRGLLGDLAAQPRLLRVRRLRLSAVPDSMLAAAQAGGGAGLPADTSAAANLPSAAGAAPFEAVVTFQVVWYTRATAAPATPDSGRTGSTAPSSSLLP